MGMKGRAGIEAVQAVGVDIDPDHRQARRAQHLGGRGPDAAGGAGDDRRTAFGKAEEIKRHHVSPCPCAARTTAAAKAACWSIDTKCPAPGTIRLVAWATPRRAASAHSTSDEYTSALQSLMRISYAVFCLITKPPH